MENGRSIPPAPMVMYWPGSKRNSMLGSSQIRNRSSVQSWRRTILAVGSRAMRGGVSMA